MKKIFLGASALAMCFTLAACGTSNADATINSLGNQLDETSNTITSINSVESTGLNMTKDMINSLATKNNAYCQNATNAKQALNNEEFYKSEILKKSSHLKSCLSNNIKLSSAQTSAVKELTKSLSKYTNSVSYTKDELEDAIKSVAMLKKKTTKNAEKISAKLNKIYCNSVTRSAYYDNILTTLDNLETFLCCDNCTDDNLTAENTNNSNSNCENCTNVQKVETKQSTEESDNDSTSTPKNNTITRNIDTYGPTNKRNIDTFGGNYYNRPYGVNNSYGYNPNYGYNNAYGYNAYGYNNMNRYPRPISTPNNPYGYYGTANANNMRVNNVAVPVAELKEETKNNENTTLSKNSTTKSEDLTKKVEENKISSNKTESLAKVKEINSNVNLDNKTTQSPRLETYEEILDNNLVEETKITNQKVTSTDKDEQIVETFSKEQKKVKRIVDIRDEEEKQKDLDQPIKAI